MNERFARLVDDADVHGPGVQIDAAVESVLLCVESHHGPPWKRLAVEPAIEHSTSKVRALRALGHRHLTWDCRLRESGGHDEYQVAAADRGRISGFPCSLWRKGGPGAELGRSPGGERVFGSPHRWLPVRFPILRRCYIPRALTNAVAAGRPGDFNSDGTVDAADHVVWRKIDGTHPGYDTWRAHFGETVGGGSTSITTVPEPASASLLIVGAAIGAWRGRRMGSRVPSTR